MTDKNAPQTQTAAAPAEAPKLTATFQSAANEKGVKPKPRSISFHYDFGSNLSEAIAKFGEAAVYKLFCTAAEQDVLAEARRLLTGGRNNANLRDDKEVLAALAAYKVGTDMASIERARKQAEYLKGLSPEALAAAGITLSK